MKRKVAVAMVAAMAVSSFTVPVLADDAAAEGGKIGISMPTQSLERWNRDGSYLQKQFEDAGYEVELTYSDNETDRQVNDIQNLISDGVNLLVVAAIDGEALNTVMDEAADAGSHVNEGLEVTRDIVGIMCGNDDLASQVVKVLSENRLAGKVAVVAQDADLAACQRIVEGTQEMTVYKPIEQEANTAAEFAVALGRGEDITSGEGEYKAKETFNDGSYDIPYYRIDPVAVTKENMDQIIIGGGFHTREDVYLNIRGKEN